MLLASLPLRHLCVRVHTQQCGGAKEAKEANEANKTIPALRVGRRGRWCADCVCTYVKRQKAVRPGCGYVVGT